MKLILKHSAVVFNGGKNSIGQIDKGEHAVREVEPLDKDGVKWYQFIDTKKIISLNPNNLPPGIVLVD